MVRLATGNGLPDVVVTGVAMTTALATDVDGTWKKLLDGQSGIRKLDDPFIEQFDLPVRIGGHLLEDFESGSSLPGDELFFVMGVARLHLANLLC